MIGFPRGAGLMYRAYVAETGVSAIGLDSMCRGRRAADPAAPGAGAGQSRSRACWSAARRWTRRSPRSSARSRRAVRVQSWPRRPARHAGGACRPPRRAAAPRIMSRTAIVLFNLGGPDRSRRSSRSFQSVRRSGGHRLPKPLRAPIAKLIARRRGTVARHIYARMGGGSPLLANTEAQARRSKRRSAATRASLSRCAIGTPISGEAGAAVKEWAPDEIVLLPLYPQFSSTTTASSLAAWRQAARAAGLDVPTRAVCCYPTAAASSRRSPAGSRPRWHNGRRAKRVRILFSAHGLPERIVARGDPYGGRSRRPRPRSARASSAGSRRSSATKAGSDRSNGSSPRPTPKFAAPGPSVSASSSCRSPSSRNIRKRWSSSTSTMASSPPRRGAALCPRADRLGDRIHRRLAALVRGAHVPLAPEAGRRICPACTSSAPAPRRSVGGALPWIKARTSSALSHGWRGCSICRGSSSITPRAARLGEVGDLQADGAPAAARHHESGDDRDLSFRGGAGRDAGRRRLGPGLDLRQARRGGGADRIHHRLSVWRQAFAADRNTRSARFYRFLNEVPTLLLILILVMVVVRPF